MSVLTEAVARLYERFPYPRYPLLARPRWQEGYAASPEFARRLADSHDLATSTSRVDPPVVLVGGCGEILPYVIRRWQSADERLLCVDLSARSLRRARFRLGLRGAGARFEHGSLERVLAEDARTYDHVDLFGVLHHLAEPTALLPILAARMRPGGTARVMVYNDKARTWIRELSRLFALMRYDRYDPRDLRAARALATGLARHLPRLAARLGQIGRASFANDARFVDTFLHAREARISITRWLDAFQTANLKPYALLDRYGELDDLENPLWRMPLAHELEERAADGRFEGNLEVYLRREPHEITRAPDTRTGGNESAPGAGTARLIGVRASWSSPPVSWFDFPETKSVLIAMRAAIWRAHLANAPIDLSRVDRRAQQRLARIGALLPSMLTAAQRDALSRPLHAEMEPPELLLRFSALPSEAHKLLETELKRRGFDDPRKIAAAAARALRI